MFASQKHKNFTMPKIKDEDIEAVRQRVNILDLVSAHVQLRKSGRSYTGRCPFHDDSSPSFSVDPSKGLYHCFGCGEGGDVFTFAMKTGGFDFNEAVEFLAGKAGYQLSYEQTPARHGSRERLYLANRYACHFFERALQAELGREAFAYAESRGITGSIAERFAVGYAPEGRDMLSAYLRKKGLSAEEIVAAGLGKFYSRLMFPIVDLQDRVVGFGGRALGSLKPKYLNSPETPIYHKGSMLYALNLSKQGIIREGKAVLVEGYTDVISLHAAGIDNAVATLGTALTTSHLRLISRFADEVVMVFDGDQAGIAAAERAKDMINEITVKVLVLPGGADPAEFVATEGALCMREALAGAPSFNEFYLRRLTEKFDITEATGRRKATAEFLTFISAIPSVLEQEEYTRRAAALLGVSIGALVVERRKVAAASHLRSATPARGIPPVPALASEASGEREREMLKLVIQFPGKVSLLTELEDNDWQSTVHRELATVLKNAAQGKANPVEQWPESVFATHLLPLVSALALEPLKAADVDRYGIGLVLRLKEFSIERQIMKLEESFGLSGEIDRQRKIQLDMQKLVSRKQELREQIGRS